MFVIAFVERGVGWDGSGLLVWLFVAVGLRRTVPAERAVPAPLPAILLAFGTGLVGFCLSVRRFDANAQRRFSSFSASRVQILLSLWEVEQELDG